MPSFSDLQNKQEDLVRKGLSGSVFCKRYEEGDDEIEALLDAEGLLALPPGYVDVGHITKDDGVGWTRDIESSDVTSLGRAEPVRRDITSDVSGLTFTMQESKKRVFELYDGVNLTDVVADANGNVSYDKPDRPANIRWRFFVLFKDGEGVDAVYFAKWLPKAEITDRGEQSWNEENELQYPVTVTAYNDSEFGTSARSLWGLPASKRAAMGFSA